MKLTSTRHHPVTPFLGVTGHPHQGGHLVLGCSGGGEGEDPAGWDLTARPWRIERDQTRILGPNLGSKVILYNRTQDDPYL